MRVLLSTSGSRGDVEPVAGLAAALRRLGAEAAVCAPPDEEIAALLARAGVEHIPLGPSVRSIMRRERPDIFELAAELVAARFEVLGAAVKDADAVLATGLFPAGARSVAEKAGVPYVFACFHTLGLPSHHLLPPRRPGMAFPPGEPDVDALWEADARNLNTLYGEAENRQRAALGLAPVADIRSHVFTERPWLAADPVLGDWREMTYLDLVETGAWVLPDERALPPEVEAFLADGEPPVYAGFGSMAMHPAPDLARVAIEAVRAHGRRVIISRGMADLGPIDDAPDCLAVGDLSHQALFRRVAAVVHHGGAGTTTTATLAGVPQVVVPQFADQPHFAARVAALGIGGAHDGPVPTVESLTAALRTALEPPTGEAARRVAALPREDGASVAARMLAGLAG